MALQKCVASQSAVVAQLAEHPSAPHLIDEPQSNGEHTAHVPDLQVGCSAGQALGDPEP
jgi:hypothetical protein